MHVVKSIMLSNYELKCARNFGFEVETFERENDLTRSTIRSEKFLPLLRFLRTLVDLSDYDDDQLESYYMEIE